MHHGNLKNWRHTHTFGQERKQPGELRTIIVIAITAMMMIIEISTGIIFGSMVLLADGLHMASHAVALTINAFSYIYARRHARDMTYSFGTGKVNSLGGFTGAVLLVIFALMMAWESVERILYPVEIALNQAIFVAVFGLIVNGASVFILGHHNDSHHKDNSTQGHVHNVHELLDHKDHYCHDHNLRAAYLHVLADALTSLLAIFALLVAKYIGLIWMDPVMGIVGAILVSRWSYGLLRITSAVLLDKQGPKHIETAIKQSIENDDNLIADLHLWSIGPDIFSVIISVVAHKPHSPEHYKELIPPDLGLVHVTVEVHQDISNYAGIIHSR